MARYEKRRDHPSRKDRRRWERLRRKVLDAANWRCARCGGYANEVDHIIPCQAGGDHWADANLQPICKACHLDKTAGENAKKIGPEAQKWRELLEQL